MILFMILMIGLSVASGTLGYLLDKQKKYITIEDALKLLSQCKDKDSLELQIIIGVLNNKR